ncbi:dol-P-Glc:Glc(2)Man(9)GlcNAc(2)-PP-Dol alpha-1,2-glucosyltransferase-like [Babylonia areolata]|uniref:dol-P-Glc:Glc(2)Man(9)GlcNAc(2)-PP-Dol alpha-1,2-glucosyltransferase-like n=1 Tax=Babylonia areolata TaxID=304850 RepID=UPI003FD36BA9
MEVKFAVAVISLLVVTFVIFLITNEVQDKSYMDEIFHVPQARQYCAGNFTAWDPMITTLPGLYLASFAIIYPTAAVLEGGDMMAACTTTALRGVNVLFCVANFYLLYLIAWKLHFNKQNTSEIVLTALALATFPVLYFFTFLYYTDSAATFFALLTYYLALRRRQVPAALTGVFAIVCRQTNVVWVVFGAALCLASVLLRWIQLEKKEERGRRDEKPLSDCMVLSKTLSLIGKAFRYNPQRLVGLGWEAVKAVWSYALVGVGFVAFVIINEGIVVGDRSNHQPCLNFPQLFYFLFLTTAFSFLHMVSVRKMVDFAKYILSNPVKTVLFFAVAVLFVTKFMFVHEYNLADNRHYNFYFLSKIVRRNEYTKFILIPAYFYAFVTFCGLLHSKDVFWKLSYLVCTAACIVPQRMIEFRYFIMPYLIFRLNMPMPSKLFLIGEVMFYFAINVTTVYMYVHKPFVWANADSFQRFMW